MATPVVEARSLSKLFPVKGGFLGRSPGRRPRGGRHLVHDRAGPDARPRGRVGLRQDHHRQDGARARGAHRREHPLRGPGPAGRWTRRAGGTTGKSVQAVFQDPFASLNPRMRVGAIIAEPLVTNESLSAAEVRKRVAPAARAGRAAGARGRRSSPTSSPAASVSASPSRARSRCRPRLVVLDEPVSALDVSIRAQILNLLRDLQAQLGLSYLFIAHDLAAVAHMSHTIAVMYLGKIVEIGRGGRPEPRRPSIPTRRRSSRRRCPRIPTSGARRSSCPARCRARSARRRAAASTPAART